MNKILIAFADRLVRRMEFMPEAPHAGMPPRVHHKPFRPDIAEAIGRGEYSFQRLTNKKGTFRYRAVLMQIQRKSRIV